MSGQAAEPRGAHRIEGPPDAEPVHFRVEVLPHGRGRQSARAGSLRALIVWCSVGPIVLVGVVLAVLGLRDMIRDPSWWHEGVKGTGPWDDDS